MPLGVAFNQIITMPDQVEQAEALAAAGHIPALVARGPTPPGVAPARPGSRRRRSRGRRVAARGRGAGAPTTDDSRRRREEEDDTAGGERFAGMPRRYYVYRRQGEPCRVCGSRIRTIVAGRNLFWCGRCQRRR